LHFDYSLFGLTFRFDLCVPQLLQVQSSSTRPDVEVRLGTFPPRRNEQLDGAERLVFSSSNRDQGNKPTHQLWKREQDSLFRLEFCDGTQFWLDSKGRRLWSTRPENLSLQSTLSYLLGPVLGFLLRLRGVVCLHASAVAVADQSVVFVGAGGAGKSTTAAAFARQGCAVLSDDVVALSEREGRFLVQPSYPHVLLWPDSSQALFGSEDTLPAISEDWDKRRLPLGDGGKRYQDTALPLAVTYILGKRCEKTVSAIDPLSGSSALLPLIANSYATGLLEPEKRAQEFEAFARLIATVPVRSLTAGGGPGGLADLCRLVQQDSQHP
jgi:hypothetical protein